MQSNPNLSSFLVKVQLVEFFCVEYGGEGGIFFVFRIRYVERVPLCSRFSTRNAAGTIYRPTYVVIFLSFFVEFSVSVGGAEGGASFENSIIRITDDVYEKVSVKN